MVTRQQLDDFYRQLLKPQTYTDYGPNGLQVEGKQQIDKIAFAVSATRDSIRQAADRHADALVVHHGLFWSFHGAKTLTGAFAKRIFPLVEHKINLFGYHLPLDGHPDIGNAARLAQLIDCEAMQAFGDYKGCPTGTQARFKKPLTATTLKTRLESVLQHSVILASDDERVMIETVGIITGGANDGWKLAAKNGLDAYITGEISEHDWHESQENGIHMFAGGHHATEQFGIQALMEKTRDAFKVDCVYIDSDNPA